MLKIKKFKPAFTGIVTTMDQYEKDVVEGGLIRVKKGTIKEYQKVLAVGSCVREVKVGDTILVDPKNYRRMKHQEGSLKDGIITDNMVVGYDFDIMEIDGKPVLYLQDRDVKGIIEDSEEVPDETIIIPNTTLIADA